MAEGTRSCPGSPTRSTAACPASGLIGHGEHDRREPVNSPAVPEPRYVQLGLALIGLVLLVAGLIVMPTIHDPTEGVFPMTVVNAPGRTVEP